jgi:N-succinyldiaminopimelate aminotransferase
MVFTPGELAQVVEVCREHDLLAVTDEVYEHLVFSDAAAGAHVPLATLPGMAERTLQVSSAGKTFSVTGWKVGWVCGPRALVAAVTQVKQFLTYTNAAPLQPAVAVGLGLGPEYFTGARDRLQAGRDQLCAGLKDAGFTVFRPEATYFVTCDIRPLGGTDGLEFCRELPERCGVVAVPTQVFYDNVEAGRHLVRFAFCKRPEVLAEAVRRLHVLRPG